MSEGEGAAVVLWLIVIGLGIALIGYSIGHSSGVVDTYTSACLDAGRETLCHGELCHCVTP